MIDLAILAMLNLAPADVAPCDPAADYATPECPSPWPDETNVSVCMTDPSLCQPEPEVVTPTDIPAASPVVEVIVEPEPEVTPAPIVVPAGEPRVDMAAVIQEIIRAIVGRLFG